MNIAIASWPDTAPTFGNQHLNQLDSCGSFWLSLREIPKTNLDDSGSRVVAQIGLYVWFDDMDNLLVEPRLRDVHSMTLADAEQAVKLLRKMCKSMNTGIVKGEHPQTYIASVLKALGIMYTLQYRPLQKNTLADTEAVVADLSYNIQRVKGTFKCTPSQITA